MNVFEIIAKEKLNEEDFLEVRESTSSTYGEIYVLGDTPFSILKSEVKAHEVREHETWNFDPLENSGEMKESGRKYLVIYLDV